MIVYFTHASPDHAIKCLVEMMRLSNKYKKGVVRKEVGDKLNGPWDAVVVSGLCEKLPAAIVFDIKDIQPDETNAIALKRMYGDVEASAKKANLI